MRSPGPRRRQGVNVPARGAQAAVIPRKREFKLLLLLHTKIKMDSRLRGNDGNERLAGAGDARDASAPVTRMCG